MKPSRTVINLQKFVERLLRAHSRLIQCQDKRGRNTVVIHPGSRWLRIGRASDILPISIPNVIARRMKKPSSPDFVRGIRRPKPLRPDEGTDVEEALEVDPVDGEKPPAPDQGVDEGTGRVAAFRMAFKDRLKTYGVRYQPGASESGANFNRVQTSEKVADHNDSQRITWIENAPPGKDTYFGHEVRSSYLLSSLHSNNFAGISPFRYGHARVSSALAL
jgi:actin-related protein 8